MKLLIENLSSIERFKVTLFVINIDMTFFDKIYYATPKMIHLFIYF